MNIRSATTYTGIGLVFLATLAYSIRVAQDPGAASTAFTITFIALNMIGWWAGGWIRRRRSEHPLGFAMSLMGDSLFPLSLYVLLLTYVPFLQLKPVHTAWVVIAIGVMFHLAGFWGLTRSSFPAGFYPYFFAAAPVALIYLVTLTHGVPVATLAWATLGFGAIFHLLHELNRGRANRHWGSAVGIVYLAACGGVLATWPGSAPATSIVLAAITTALLFALAARSSDQGGQQRFFTAASYMGLTTVFTTTLMFLHASLPVFLVATAAWVWTLTVLGVVIRARGGDAYGEGAQWASIVIAAALAWVTSPVWLSLVGPVFERVTRSGLLAGLAPSAIVLVPACLAAVSGALWLSAFWNGRYPALAQSLAGFVANQALVAVLTYASPILLVMAGGALASALGAGVDAVVWTEFAVGAAFLTLVSTAIRGVFPRGAFDLAGCFAVALAGANALRVEPALALIVFAAGIPVLGWRAATDSGVGRLLALLTGIAAAGYAGSRAVAPGWTMLPVAWIPVAFALVWRLRKGMSTTRAKERWTLVLAIAAMVMTGWLEFRVGLSWPVFLVLWAGPLVILVSDARNGWAPRGFDIWLQRLLYVAATLAGGGLLLALMVAERIPKSLDGVALGVWAWMHLAFWRYLARQAEKTPLTRATLYATHVFGIGSIVASIAWSTPWFTVLCALGYAALWFQHGLWYPLTRSATLTAYGVTGLAVILGLFGGVAPTVLALFGASFLALRRSALEGSASAHGTFIVTATAGAVVGALWGGPRADFLPVALLSILLVLAARWVRRLEGQNRKVQATLISGVGVAALALVCEYFSAGRSPIVFATLWGGLLLGLVKWDRRRSRATEGPPNGVERRRAVSPGTGLAATLFPGTPDEKTRSFAYLIANLSGVAALTLGAPAYGVSRTEIGVLVAAWAWLHLGVLMLLSRTMPNRVVTKSTAKGVHVFAAIALGSAVFGWRFGLSAAMAAGAISALYLALSWVSRRPVLEHFAAVAGWIAILLAGVALRIPYGDYYAAPVGLYLAVHLTLRHMRHRRTVDEARPAGFRFGLAEVVPTIVLLLAVLVPLVELIRQPLPMHLYYLGVGGLLLMHAMAVTRQHSLFTYAGCAALFTGSILFIAVGPKAPVTDVFLVLAGAFGVLNLVFVQGVRLSPSEQRA